jgi:hypothetical protein
MPGEMQSLPKRRRVFNSQKFSLFRTFKVMFFKSARQIQSRTKSEEGDLHWTKHIDGMKAQTNLCPNLLNFSLHFAPAMCGHNLNVITSVIL